jgi:hypothetical protein
MTAPSAAARIRPLVWLRSCRGAGVPCGSTVPDAAVLACERRPLPNSESPITVNSTSGTSARNR